MVLNSHNNFLLKIDGETHLNYRQYYENGELDYIVTCRKANLRLYLSLPSEYGQVSTSNDAVG